MESEGVDSAGVRSGWIEDAERVDAALYAAVARTPTPTLDRLMTRLSRAADHSGLWVGAAAALSATGPRGRRAAGHGLTAIGVTSAVVNLAMKPAGRRRRPARAAERVPVARHVRMPTTTSFPSGHAASAFAFATAVGSVDPRAGVPLRGLAAMVGYSRVHTGVHYPGDVVAGALVGSALAQITGHFLRERG
jgi:undecaprenyl-diphosphatase